MEERHRVRLGQILWRSRLREWDRKGIEERCEGWWPSLAFFVAEQLGETRWPLPEEALDVLDVVGRAWIARGEQEARRVGRRPGTHAAPWRGRAISGVCRGAQSLDLDSVTTSGLRDRP